jgi:hypothetical protein
MMLQSRSQKATTLQPLRCLCPLEIVAAFLRRSCRAVAVDDRFRATNTYDTKADACSPMLAPGQACRSRELHCIETPFAARRLHSAIS